MRLVFCLILVLLAFAGNSVLARLALAGGDIGPWAFSGLRFVSGAVMLLILSQPKESWPVGNWTAAIALCAYGVFFSFAYLELATGTGALLLFASVQLTMLAVAFSRGERLCFIRSRVGDIFGARRWSRERPCTHVWEFLSGGNFAARSNTYGFFGPA